MPEITVVHIVLLAAVALIGVVAGWIVRGSRAVRERQAVNAGWQEQIKEERSEAERLAEQNKYLHGPEQPVAGVQPTGNEAREGFVGLHAGSLSTSQ